MLRTRSLIFCLLIVAGAALMPAAATAASSGTLTVSDGGNRWMNVQATVNSTDCSGGGTNCGFAYIVERHSTLTCKPDLTFIRGVELSSERPQTRQVSWIYRPFFPRQGRLCLYLSTDPFEPDTLLADVVYPVPQGYGWLRSSQLFCSDFGSQSGAQYYFYLYPDNPSSLPTEGGVCRYLDCPCGAEWVPAEPGQPSPPIAVTPTPSGPTSCSLARARQRDLERRVAAARRQLAQKLGRNATGAERWRWILKQRKARLREANARVAKLC